MVGVLGFILGVCMCGVIIYFTLVYKKNSNEMLLDTLKTTLTVSDYNSSDKQAPVDSDSERLSLFNIKDTKDLSVNISAQDKEYLLTEFIKLNKQLVPYGNIIEDKDYLYPTMYFRVYLNKNVRLSHSVKGSHIQYGFTIDRDEFKELSRTILEGHYELRLIGGPYRVLDELTGEYTEFNDNPINALIEVPLKSFIRTK